MKAGRRGVPEKRAYRMGARAQSAQETRERILQAAHELWIRLPYDDVTLDQVAERADVTKQTVLRLFTSKDQLAFAVVDWQRPREEAAREAPAGDVDTAIARLLDRYEEMGDANVRVLDLERRVPAVSYLLAQARESHRLWIEHVFAPFLPARRGASHRRRVMAFYAATEVALWKLLRRDFELSRADTEAVIRDLIAGVICVAQKEKP